MPRAKRLLRVFSEMDTQNLTFCADIRTLKTSLWWPFEILRTAEFDEWFCELPLKVKVIVEARLERLAEEGHWGFVNRFDNLIELKWTSGLRIYTAQINNMEV